MKKMLSLVVLALGVLLLTPGLEIRAAAVVRAAHRRHHHHHHRHHHHQHPHRTPVLIR